MKNLNIMRKAFAVAVGKALLVAALAVSAGCINLMTRPKPNCETETIYQPTRLALGILCVPCYSDVPTDVRWAVGLLSPVIAVDCVCEGVIDTVLLPYDYFYAVPQYEKRHSKDYDDGPYYDEVEEEVFTSLGITRKGAGKDK